MSRLENKWWCHIIDISNTEKSNIRCFKNILKLTQNGRFSNCCLPYLETNQFIFALKLTFCKFNFSRRVFSLDWSLVQRKMHKFERSSIWSLPIIRVFYFCAELSVFFSEGRFLHESVVMYSHILVHQIWYKMTTEYACFVATQQHSTLKKTFV